jgi:hypothetical protein
VALLRDEYFFLEIGHIRWERIANFMLIWKNKFIPECQNIPPPPGKKVTIKTHKQK